MDKKKETQNAEKSPKTGPKNKKKDRLEATLRANLLRRKQQPKPKK